MDPSFTHPHAAAVTCLAAARRPLGAVVHAHVSTLSPLWRPARAVRAVSRSEEGQSKRLMVLDSAWQVEEEIPLDVGHRYFTLPGLAQGLEAAERHELRPGDRVR